MNDKDTVPAVVRTEPAPGVVVLCLNSPQQRNSLTAQTVSELAQGIRAATDSKGAGAVVITAEGSSFCSGGAVDEMALDAPGPAETRVKLRRVLQEAVTTVWEAEIPVVAALNGAAVGAGLDLALACDVRIACQSARLSTGYVRVGLVPAEGGAWLLPRIIGIERALRLLWTGRMIDAAEALDLGMVSEVVPDQMLRDRAIALACEIAQGPRTAQALIKRAVHEGLTLGFRQSLELGASHAAITSVTADHREGVAAFLEKRPPSFGGGSE